MKNLMKIYASVTINCLLLFASCEKDFLPKDRESLSYDMRVSNYLFNPILGRNTIMSNNFVVGNSSQPLNFEIENFRTYYGEDAPELDSAYAVKVWDEAYNGKETSLEEIESKRSIEYHRLFEVYPHAGVFKMWYPSRSSFIKTLPDSCYKFDLKVSSDAGGVQYFRNLQLKPYRERDYEPNNFDAFTGNTTIPYLRPSINTNIIGDSTLAPVQDIRIYFQRNGDGNALSFKFLDKYQNTIDPNNFNRTDWPNTIHGFNMVINKDSVRYDASYPIPLANIKTNYTNISGSLATVNFSYSRIGFGNQTLTASLGLDFAIYREGNWTIIFQFVDDSPKFSNN